jgi:hypothetical protein
VVVVEVIYVIKVPIETSKIEVVVSLGLTVFESDERRALTLRK